MEEYRKLQLHLPKMCWSAYGNSWITGWMCGEVQMELMLKLYNEN